MELLLRQVNIQFPVSSHHLVVEVSINDLFPLDINELLVGLINCTCYGLRDTTHNLLIRVHHTAMHLLGNCKANRLDRSFVRCVKVESCSINRALLCICAATKRCLRDLLCSSCYCCSWSWVVLRNIS